MLIFDQDLEQVEESWEKDFVVAMLLDPGPEEADKVR